MKKAKAVELLKLAVPIKALTQQEYADFIEAVNMGMDALKAQLSREDTTSDLISRQAAIDTLNEYFARIGKLKRRGLTEGEKAISLDTVGAIKTLPPVQPEPSIPLSWIDKYIEWLQSFDNEFANLEAAHISVMVKKWRDEQDERTD